MKRLSLSILILVCCALPALSNHIKGGFFSYEYLGTNPNDPTKIRYSVKLTVYMLCNPTGPQVNQVINFSIFDGASNVFIRDASVSLTNRFQLSKDFDDPCITDNQAGCYYEIIEYSLPELELSINTGGYTIAYQRCCRIAGINNLSSPSSDVGNTFTIKIPGNGVLNGAYVNSSPRFLVNDTAVVCSGSYFQYSFRATDSDRDDSLSYSFCSAYAGGTPGASAPATAANPPYSSVPYSFPFNGSQPMGSGVTIDERTGLISGVAPSMSGDYVVCVCVNEYRQGVLIGITRKELHVKVGDCQSVDATLQPSYVTCDGYTLTFSNLTSSSLINSFYWEFGDPASGVDNSSTLANPTHTFSDTGTYIIKLITNKDQPCTDTATAIAKVYPGFFPGFTTGGVCYLNPVQFTDTTKTRYGVVDSWSWNFGDLTTLADTSHNQNPRWTYAGAGPKTINFIVTSSKGCRDTVTQVINMLDKPVITLNFKDTLICRNDNVQLQASGTGVFSWTPNVNITGANTATPTVSPTTTTTYQVQLDDQGCINTDSVKVRVVNFVTLNVMPDTTICATDPAQLRIVSDALRFSWSPAGSLNNPTIQNPIALAGITDTYTVTATIGGCSETRNIGVTAVPYPIANAGVDPTMCYNVPIQLNGSHNGSSFTWSPTTYLTNTNTLTPTANPPTTRQYVLSSFDTRGCPKPGRDTVLVTVLPKILPWAGRDTSVIVNQPLQFNATGGASYQWFPATGLSSTTIADPIGTYGANIDSIRYKVLVFNEVGCVDSAYVTVRVFKTVPSVFVATAFTPNGDGRNDIIAPVAVGMKQINYFSVYNRWGQLVFKTSVNGAGWDGRIKGVMQSTNVFVWMVSAVDYLGNPYFKKGTVTLIR